MVLGMSLASFTLLHVLISLVGIGSGLVVLYGLLTSKRFNSWTMLFLVSTAATSLTGFLFPFKGITPGIVIGILSIVVLAGATVARYTQQMSGAWRAIYVACSLVALYFNIFVLVVQSFEKVPALRALAPTQKEAPFVVTQFLLLGAFIVLTTLTLKRFHPKSTLTAFPQTPGRKIA